MPAPETTTLRSMISQEEDHLQELTRRLYVVEGIQRELDRVTKGKPFRIWGDIAWMMLLDTRDAFIIQFASWARSLYAKGGFLRKVQAHHIRLLRRHRKAAGAEEDTFLRGLLSRHHEEAFGRLFPTVTSSFPKPEDVERARCMFFEQFAPVVNDRDSNRAHPYEEHQSSSSPMLDFHELRRLVEQAQTFLNDLRLVACDSTLAYSNMNINSVEDVAEELVDQLLIGTRARRCVVQHGREREAYYLDLHIRHDQCDRDPKPLFNDYWEDD